MVYSAVGHHPTLGPGAERTVRTAEGHQRRPHVFVQEVFDHQGVPRSLEIALGALVAGDGYSLLLLLRPPRVGCVLRLATPSPKSTPKSTSAYG